MEIQKKHLAGLLVVNFSFIIMALFAFKYFSNDSKKFAYIDSQILLTEYKGMVDVKKEFVKRSQVWEAKMDTLSKNLEDDVKAYEKEKDHMTVGEKKAKEELLRHKQQQLINYKDGLKQQALKEEQELTGDVYKTINEFIKDYGSRKGYSIVFGTVQGNILYAIEPLNITKEILEGLNENYSKAKK